MTDRKKKAVGFLVSGGVFLVAGIATFAADMPSWLPTIVSIVAAIAGVVGISVTMPEV